MAKYDPLNRYLLKQRAPELLLSFAEIERILDAPLPVSASRPQFWANTVEAHGHVHRAALKGSGYNAFLVTEKNAVRFVKHNS